MKTIYQELWKIAKPYYLKGRPFDIEHIKILSKDALVVCKKEKIDDSLLLPLIILHDIGYGVTKPAYFQKELKKAHMIAGAKLCKEILKKINYPKEKIDKIAYWISVHDNWIFGDDKIYHKDLILAVFNDLDFTWMATSKGFGALSETIYNGDRQKMLKHIENDSKMARRPFATKTTKELYSKYIKERKTELLK